MAVAVIKLFVYHSVFVISANKPPITRKIHDIRPGACNPQHQKTRLFLSDKNPEGAKEILPNSFRNTTLRCTCVTATIMPHISVLFSFVINTNRNLKTFFFLKI